MDPPLTVRIVGGEARGRQIRAPAGRGTRPTSDRVREAMFAVLGSLSAAGVAPPLEEARVADLFAGSGALGIEALSRGAAHATFVDADSSAIAAIRRNLDDLGLAGRDRSTVVQADALRWLRRLHPATEVDAGAIPAGEPSLDVVFCDPPYRFEQWSELARLLAPVAGIAVLEAASVPPLGPQWEILKEKRYGSTVVLVARLEPARDRRGDL